MEDSYWSKSSSHWNSPRSSFRARSISPVSRFSRMDSDRRRYRRDDSSRWSSGGGSRFKKENRVYVGNLAFSCRWYDLKDFMRDAGHVVFADVMQDSEGLSKGCGIVEYSKPDEAQRAISELNDKMLMGRQIFVREDREDRSAGPSAGGSGGFPRSGAFAPQSTKIYIGGLNELVGWQDLKDLFRHYGSVIRADIDLDSEGKSKLSGTVIMANSSDAHYAIRKLDGQEINGMKLEVTALPSNFGLGSKPPSKFDNVAPSKQIFTKNLPYTTTDEDLIELFQTIGSVQHAQVQHENGRSKGTGIVQFASIEDAEAAIAKLNGYVYGGRPLQLLFNAKWKEFD